jgi:exopolysaccharide biosynthesis polyprenyl glycosylphosphotransferase
MDTLREGKTSLLATPPEREHTVSRSDRLSETAIVADRNIAGIVPPAKQSVVAMPGDRSAAGYIHPEIPCKLVPYAFAKRAFDLVLASTMLVAASPIMFAAAIAIAVDSRGPVIFRQTRVGRGGRYFTCYKFRSMCADAERKKDKLRHLNEMDGPVFKIRQDPRITKVGAFIRKYSIDELPQLINVIRGEMSIVGPRPPVPHEVEQYGERERGRLAVQPGLTCLWQVSGRSNIAFEKWVELDLEYIEHMSMRNDVRIFLKTVPAVLTGAGAH